MQQAIPYMTHIPVRPVDHPSLVVENLDNSFKEIGMINGGGTSSVKGMVTDNPVLVLGIRGCCMCHAMKRLLLSLGVNPGVYEVDEEDEMTVIDELVASRREEGKEEDDEDDGRPQFPCVYIGGRLFGGLDRLIAAHISGELVPLLKQAGALWL